jgi:hypothetical protein
MFPSGTACLPWNCFISERGKTGNHYTTAVVPLYEVCLIRIKEKIHDKRSTFETHRNADCLLKIHVHQTVIRVKSDWSGIRVMFPSGTAYLPWNCFISVLAL